MMDPLFEAMILFRQRKYERCAEICSEALERNPYDQVSDLRNFIKSKLQLQIIFWFQAFWCLKMRCFTEQVYVDDLEADEEGIAEMLDENSIAQVNLGFPMDSILLIAKVSPKLGCKTRNFTQNCSDC